MQDVNGGSRHQLARRCWNSTVLLLAATMMLQGCAQTGPGAKLPAPKIAPVSSAGPNRITPYSAARGFDHDVNLKVTSLLSKAMDAAFDRPDPAAASSAAGKADLDRPSERGCADCNGPPASGYPRHDLYVTAISYRADDKVRLIGISALVELRNLSTGQVDYRTLANWGPVTFDGPAPGDAGNSSLQKAVSLGIQSLLEKFATRDRDGFWVDAPEKLAKLERRPAVVAVYDYQGPMQDREVAHKSRVDLSLFISDPELLSALIVLGKYRPNEIPLNRRDATPMPLRPGADGGIQKADDAALPYIERVVEHFPLQPGENEVYITGWDKTSRKPVIQERLVIVRDKPVKPVSSVVIWDAYHRFQEPPPQANLDLQARFKARGADATILVQDDYMAFLDQLVSARKRSDPVSPSVIYFNGAVRRLSRRLFFLGRPKALPADDDLLDASYHGFELPQSLYAVGDSAIFLVDACGTTQDGFVGSGDLQKEAAISGFSPLPWLFYYDGPCGKNESGEEVARLRAAVARAVRFFKTGPKAEAYVSNEKFLNQLKAELPGVVVVGGPAVDTNLASALEPFAEPIPPKPPVKPLRSG